MVEKIEERVEIPDEASADEHGKVNIHINMPPKAYERVKRLARYAAIEGLIEGHHTGNFSQYCNFCFDLGEQYILKKRGYK